MYNISQKFLFKYVRMLQILPNTKLQDLNATPLPYSINLPFVAVTDLYHPGSKPILLFGKSF